MSEKGRMMMCNYNGILVQDINEPTRFVKRFKYLGINAFWQFPLRWIDDREARELTKEQSSKEVAENSYVSLEFISNSFLYQRYIKKCKELKLSFRVLFIQSSYEIEVWEENLPNLNFLGYEYCSIPLDEQIITDMDWYEPFTVHVKKLNEYGLFNTYDDALQFADDYNNAFRTGEIGDGDADNYIIKI